MSQSAEATAQAGDLGPLPLSPAAFDAEGVITGQRHLRLSANRRRKMTYHALRILIVVAFIGAWQFMAVRSTPLVLPEPLAVFNETVGRLDFVIAEMWVTLQEAIVGAILGGVVGLGLGVLIAYSRLASAVLNPFVVASQSVPKVALAPLFVVWLGFGMAPKVAVAALISFFPLLENTVVGLQRVDVSYVKLFRMSGANARQIFWRLRLVNAAPYILTGARISLLYSFIGAIVGEFIAGNRGLGAAILTAQGVFNTTLMFGLITVLTLLGLVIYGLVRLVENFVLNRLHLAVAEDARPSV